MPKSTILEGKGYSATVALATVAAAGAILFLDLSLPLGVAGGVPYVAIVLAGWWFKSLRSILILAVLSSLLTLAGYLFSPEGGIPWVVVTNRILALFAIWVTAFLLSFAKRAKIRDDQSFAHLQVEVSNRKKAEIALLEMNKYLEERVNARTKSLQEEIAEHKQTEEELQESRRVLRTVFDTIPHLLTVKDRESNYLMVNSAHAEMYEMKARDFEGLHTRDVPGRSDYQTDGILQSDQQVFADGKRYDYPAKLIHYPNGRTQIREMIKSPLLDEEGNITGLVSVTVDITERMKLEEQVKESQKMETVGKLAGGIAHEFNNMLQVILGHLELALANKEIPEKARENLAHVRKAAEKAADLTNQLLAYSRKKALVFTHFDINELLTHQTIMLRSIIGEDIDLNFIPLDDRAITNGDAGAMEQMMLNFCLNARDAMPNGGSLTIEIARVVADSSFRHAHPWAGEKDYLTISVTDTGMGMEPEVMEHVFEPFFTTKGVGKGTGLGLSMIYGTVHEHGGMVEVESESGIGSTFRCFLPRIINEKYDGPPNRNSPGSEGTETILVAEDDPDVLELSSSILERMGYKVLKAENGEEALHVLSDHDYNVDLVLLDVVMPIMGGREIYEKIMESHPTLPVVFCTGHSDEKMDSKFLAENKPHLIKKPFSSNDLSEIIRKTLRGG